MRLQFFVNPHKFLRGPELLKLVDYAHQLPRCATQEFQALTYQMFIEHRLDFCVTSKDTVATNTLILHLQHAEVLVLSLTHAFLVYAQDSFAALTLKF